MMRLGGTLANTALAVASHAVGQPVGAAASMASTGQSDADVNHISAHERGQSLARHAGICTMAPAIAVHFSAESRLAGDLPDAICCVSALLQQPASTQSCKLAHHIWTQGWVPIIWQTALVPAVITQNPFM